MELYGHMHNLFRFDFEYLEARARLGRADRAA
jgi:hypothetical protein